MRIRTLLVLLALFNFSFAFSPIQAARADALIGSSASDLNQFTAAGHVLGFEPSGMYLATGSHAVRIDFVGATGVQPLASGSSSGKSALQPVVYRNLWKGVTVTFQPVQSGLLKSTYLLAPGAAVSSIRLRYNVAAEIDSAGGLSLHLPSGEYRESPPVAWQDIGGARVPVETGFQALGGQEIGFTLGKYDSAFPVTIDPTLTWNTFLGSATDYDEGAGSTVDGSGNIYVTGDSEGTWGSPLRPYTADYDTFVAKLYSNGTVAWGTFLGGSMQDTSAGIDLDSSGNIYVIGLSYAAWGDSPRRAFSSEDVFVAKLNNDGVLQWNTFLGSDGADSARAIATDGSGNVYAAGASYRTWGTVNPRPYTGIEDGFVAKLNSSGDLQWNTFLGGAGYDRVNGIGVDSSGNAIAVGMSASSWGSPLRGLSGLNDAFVAKLDGSGSLQWSASLGGANDDDGAAVALDGAGNISAAGTSYATWGDSPRRPFSPPMDSFAAKLSGTGILQWNTFLGGSSSMDYATGIAVDASGSVYIENDSTDTWGSPTIPFSGTAGSNNVSVAKLDNAGYLQWNTFLGGAAQDYGRSIVAGPGGNVYVTGESGSTWGSPLQAFHGTDYADAFVAAIPKDPNSRPGLFLPLVIR